MRAGGVRNQTEMGHTMTAAKSGDTVRIHYTGTLQDGTVFDSSQGRDPLEFTVGSGQVIPGLDKHLPGMSVGDTKTVTAEAADAYGPSHDEAIQDVPREQIPADLPLEIGTQLKHQRVVAGVAVIEVATHRHPGVHIRE